MAYPVMPEHGAAAGGVLVLALLKAKVCFGVWEHTLIAAGEPELAPARVRHLSARLVDRLHRQRSSVTLPPAGILKKIHSQACAVYTGEHSREEAPPEAHQWIQHGQEALLRTPVYEECLRSAPRACNKQCHPLSKRFTLCAERVGPPSRFTLQMLIVFAWQVKEPVQP